MSSPEFYYALDELERFNTWPKVAKLFSQKYKVDVISMYETHYDYFLKDLKRSFPEVSKHRKNAPIILINNNYYYENIAELI